MPSSCSHSMMRSFPLQMTGMAVALMTVTMTVMMIITMPTCHGKVPDVSSTKLQMHKMYMLQPPHDRSLYDVLEVLPNATSAQITKQYRVMTRKYHPDKLRHKQTARGLGCSGDEEVNRGKAAAGNENYEKYSKDMLRSIQEAYEILRDDARRLPYHQYGIIDPTLAILLMAGPSASDAGATSTFSNPEQRELFELMGYEVQRDYDSLRQQYASGYDANNNNNNNNVRYGSPYDSYSPTVSTSARFENRVQFMAVRLVERIRPLVEGVVDEQDVMHHVAEECDRLKRLPMGAQILRCIGRGYRHVGAAYLQQLEQRQKGLHERVGTDISLGFRSGWRKAKHVLEATFVGSRAVVTEQIWSKEKKLKLQHRAWQRERERKRREKAAEAARSAVSSTNDEDGGMLEYEGDGDDIGLEDLDSFYFDNIDEYDGNDLDLFDLESEYDQKLKEQFHAKQVILSNLQIEALWKVSKITLDKVARHACHKILEQEYFFFPVTYNRYPGSGVESQHLNGWVSPYTNATMHARSVSKKAAQAMVLIGDVMVQCSKQDTAWKGGDE